MDNNRINEYPYGQFPTKFTKLGQEKYFEQLTNQNQVSTLSTPEPTPQQNNNNNFDISKLLPLIKMMSDKKSISSSDMLQMFLPLIGGGNISGLSEIMSLFNKDSSSKEDEEDLTVDGIKIDDYKRID